MCGLVKKPVVLSDDVYWWLVKRKFELRARSIDEVIRIEIPQIPTNERSFTQVKLYSFENGDDYGVHEDMAKK